MLYILMHTKIAAHSYIETSSKDIYRVNQEYTNVTDDTVLTVQSLYGRISEIKGSEIVRINVDIPSYGMR